MTDDSVDTLLPSLCHTDIITITKQFVKEWWAYNWAFNVK
jgi:hypothetical protein